MAEINLDKYVLQVVRGETKPIRLSQLMDKVRKLLVADDPKLAATARIRLGEAGFSIYGEVGASTQRLKHAGKLELVRGKGSGWILAVGVSK